MFENIIGQPVTFQLIEDIKSNVLPPSILFSGPDCSGKLTAALELARTVCCSEKGNWNCTCQSCLRHKELMSSDVLIIGARDYISEIRAAAQTFLNVKSTASHYLFLRSIRKLLSRFDARLWDITESVFLKAASMIEEIEEIISDLNSENIETADEEKLKKKVEYLITKVTKLQDECMYDTIPVNQVRKASSWIRLMPTGKKKILIIENADKMQEGTRNAFLKILEEPPLYAFFILTTSRRGAIMPTILSRVRTYTFLERKDEAQEEVIRRVFKSNIEIQKNNKRFNILNSFFYSFLPVDFKTIQNTAAVFYEIIFNMLKKENKILPSALNNAVIEYKNLNGYDDTNNNISSICTALNKFKPHTVYILFLNNLLFFLHIGLKSSYCTQKECEAYFKITELIRDSETVVGIFNISAQAALENLSQKIKEVLA